MQPPEVKKTGKRAKTPEQALAAVGLDVYAAVEVSGTHFAEIGRVKPRDAADRIYVISGVEPLALRPGADRREKQ